jgi:hypothetical protein
MLYAVAIKRDMIWLIFKNTKVTDPPMWNLYVYTIAFMNGLRYSMESKLENAGYKSNYFTTIQSFR